MRRLLGVVLILTFVVGLITLVWTRRPPAPHPTVSPEPTLSPTPVVIRGQLVVKSVYPGPGRASLGNTNNAVAIAFDRPVDPVSTRVAISPHLDLDVRVRKDNPNRIVIQPKTNWGVGINYTVRVFRGVLSLDNSAELKKDIVLVYQMVEPELPAYDQPP